MSYPPGFYIDVMHRLVCVPYSREALHAMAVQLRINRCWFHRCRFHAGSYDHYDVPKMQVRRVRADPRVRFVSAREILAIAKGATA